MYQDQLENDPGFIMVHLNWYQNLLFNRILSVEVPIQMYVLLFVGTIAYAFLCMRENMFILYMIVGLRKDSLYVGDSFAGTCQPNYS